MKPGLGAIASGLCFFCDGPVGKKNGRLNLALWRGYGRVSHPSDQAAGGAPVGYLSHARCGPVGVYVVSLGKLEGVLDRVCDASWAQAEHIAAVVAVEQMVNGAGGRP